MQVLLLVAPGSTQTAVVSMANKGTQISIGLDAESMAWIFGYFSAEQRLAKITMREELRDASKCCAAFDRCKCVFLVHGPFETEVLEAKKQLPCGTPLSPSQYQELLAATRAEAEEKLKLQMLRLQPPSSSAPSSDVQSSADGMVLSSTSDGGECQ